MTLTLLQYAIWPLLILLSGQFEYVPMSGPLDVPSLDGRTMAVSRAGVFVASDGRCVLYVHVDQDNVDSTPDETRLHELAHILDCLDNQLLDGSPMPASADQTIIPMVLGCQRNAAERFACWYVANVDPG